MKLGKLLIGAALVSGLMAVGSTPGQAENELLGGLLGGAAGAGVGGLLGGGKGAAIGGILGLGVGALGANRLSKEDEPEERAYATPPPPAYPSGYAAPPPPAYQQGYAPPPPPPQGQQGYGAPPPQYQQGYAPPPPAYQPGYAAPAPQYQQGYAPPAQPAQQAPAATAAYDTSYCREYTNTTMIDGQEQVTTGMACRQPDGSWRIVN